MSKKDKILYSVVSVMLAASVILCITVIAQVMSRGYVSFLGTSFFRVATGSMEPTIATGSLLISEKTEIEEIEVDDIICFRSKESNMLGQVITHRVVSVMVNDEGQTYLETCGDANPSVDGYYVTESNLIGKVSYYTKQGNIVARIFSMLMSKTGFLSCIVFPVLLIAGVIMRDSVRSIRKELQIIAQESEKVSSDVVTPEEYEAMVNRLKKEILEEVRQGVEKTGDES